MEATERLVRTWMASGRDDELAKTVSDVSSGHSTLLNVVKALGEYLTSEEDLLRTKGVDFLSQVIERCPPERINRQATRVLVTFYSGKLEDPEIIIPALKGLVPLTALSTFSGVDAVETVKALFSHVVIKDLNQSTRYLVFKTLDSLMALHRDALKGMGNEFLTGYTSLVDGEKDPRNLMIAFSIDRVICIEFDISRHVEELFNVIFCYFPITFKPPADDPYGITPEDLKQTLRSCLNSSPLFGQLAIPLFLDKLLAGSPSTKKDIIVTMASCIPVYGASVARTFAKKLWNSLKLEVFQPVNTEIEGAALKSTQVLIQTIYGTETKESSDKLEGLVKEICEECLELMGEPEKSQAVPASKVIAALVGTTPDITRFALSQAIPRLMKLFRDPGELVHRPQILTLLCVVVGAVDTNQTILVDDYGLQAQLLSFKDDILGAFISGTKAPTSLEAGLEGLRKLSQMQDVLTEEELVYVVHNINEILQTNGEEAGDASDDALDVLITIADKNSKVVEESTLPLLFTSLPDSPPARDAHADRAKYWRTLRWLARLCVSAPLFETLVVRLSTKLDLVCAPKTSCGEAQDTETRTAYAHSILRTLTSVLELKVNARHSDVPKYIDRLVPRLYNLFIYLSSAETSYGFIVTDSRLLSVAGQVITLVVQTIPIERQKKLALDLRSAYFEGNVAPLAVGHQVIPIDIVFKPFETSSSSLQRNTSFHKEVLLPEIELNEFLSNVQSWSLHDADNDFQRQSGLSPRRPGVALFISSQLETVWKNDIADTAKPSEQRRQTIESWLWVKHRIFELFDDSEIGWDAARAVGKIASGGDTVLTKQNHAVIRILYAQRYFKAVLPKVMEGLKGPVQMPRQKASLVALTSLITSLPKTTYISDVPTLMPYLIRGLDLPDIGIRINIINTLSAVADSGGQGPTQEHANTLVSVMLKNALPQELTSVSLRVAALKYLAMLPGVVRYDILHPHKASVIRELEKSLDDAKRAVRKEAVRARTSWFLYQG
ncbi:ARM repeat-containing protein [Phellopilus nigrolimitatus]|nr:ARM repeat-containing protein [Phellopilus nigrolimitatus]